MRVLVFSIAALVLLLVGFIYLPAEIRPGITVRRFHQLPEEVVDDLISRGCNILRGNNVISGDFTGTGRRDWAVLCQQGNVASVYIYAGVNRPRIFGTHSVGLVDDPEAARHIRLAGWDVAS